MAAGAIIGWAPRQPDLRREVATSVGVALQTPFPVIARLPPALSEVVPTDPVDADPAKLLENRRAWASLAEGDSIYIRIHHGDFDREELFDLREDARQSRNLALDPARQSVLERMRAMLDQMIAGPLTPQRFPL
jgi:hypothetical protein